MLVFADVLSNENKLVFYNHKVGWEKIFHSYKKQKEKQYLSIIMQSLLSLSARAFIDWVTKGKIHYLMLEEGLRVLKVLEMAKKDLVKW